MTRFELTPIGKRSRATKAEAKIPEAGVAVEPGLTSCSRITRLRAIKLIGARDLRPADDVRSSENRARGLIDEAVRRGDLEFRPAGNIALGDLVAWARTKPKLRAKFADLPYTKSAAALEAHVAVKTGIAAELSPGTLDECRIELGAAKVLIRHQQVQLAALQRELAALRPLEIKRKERSETAKRSGGIRHKDR